MTNEDIRVITGNVTIENKDKLTAFLYTLMRDHLPAGVVEELVRENENIEDTVKYTNGYLARYAELLAYRLTDKDPNQLNMFGEEEK